MKKFLRGVTGVCVTPLVVVGFLGSMILISLVGGYLIAEKFIYYIDE